MLIKWLASLLFLLFKGPFLCPFQSTVTCPETSYGSRTDFLRKSPGLLTDVSQRCYAPVSVASSPSAVLPSASKAVITATTVLSSMMRE